MLYYQAGYYLTKIKTLDFGSLVGRKVITASSCLNDNYLDSWAYSWAGQEDKAGVLEEYGWPIEKLKAVEQWVDAQFDAGQVGWTQIFRTLEAAKEYRQLFFEDDNNILCLGISFSATEEQDLREGLCSQVGLQQFIAQQIPENPTGKVLGYDLIGVEIDSSIHSLHCHELQADLEQKFDLGFNEYGLIETCQDWSAVIDYCNDENTGLTPVPWFYAKVKLYE